MFFKQLDTLRKIRDNVVKFIHYETNFISAVKLFQFSSITVNAAKLIHYETS